MASLGPGNYVVVVLHVGGSKASDIKLVLQREPRIGKTLFIVGSILPNEEFVDAAGGRSRTYLGSWPYPDRRRSYVVEWQPYSSAVTRSKAPTRLRPFGVCFCPVRT
jgi:hypothetical protein